MRIDPLTPRKIECAEMVADGMTTREIANALHVGDQRVKSLTAHVMQKTDTRFVFLKPRQFLGRMEPATAHY